MDEKPLARQRFRSRWARIVPLAVAATMALGATTAVTPPSASAATKFQIFFYAENFPGPSNFTPTPASFDKAWKLGWKTALQICQYRDGRIKSVALREWHYEYQPFRWYLYEKWDCRDTP